MSHNTISFPSRMISIWVDGYDDLFSDFDFSDYMERNISVDFLAEVKRIAQEDKVTVNGFKLLIPKSQRKLDIENAIVKRLQNHFRNTYLHISKNIRAERRKGLTLVILGSVMLITASYILFLKPEKFYLHALFVVLEPAGWFMSWNGLDKLFSTTRINNHEYNFYRIMSKCKIEFINKEQTADKDHIFT